MRTVSTLSPPTELLTLHKYLPESSTLASLMMSVPLTCFTRSSSLTGCLAVLPSTYLYHLERGEKIPTLTPHRKNSKRRLCEWVCEESSRTNFTGIYDSTSSIGREFFVLFHLWIGTGKAVASQVRYARLRWEAVAIRLPSILRPDVRGATFELGSFHPRKCKNIRKVTI